MTQEGSDAGTPGEAARRGAGHGALSISSGIVLTLIGLWGCLSIYSAKALGDSPLYFAGRQMLWLLLGLLAFGVASRIPFWLYRALAPLALGLCAASLLAVLKFGVSINGMSGWFPLGGGALVQPSEFAKAPFLLLLCMFASDKRYGEAGRFLRMGGIAALFGLLIAAEPDFGGASIFFAGFLIVHWISGGRLSLLMAALLCFALFGSLFILRNDYAMSRLVGFLHPDADILGSGWHVKQFQYTMAHGGLFGSNWGNALWSNAFLPLPHSDSVYASIVESTGLAGGLIVTGGFVALVFAFNSISKKAADPAARNFIFATGALYGVQALIHISVNVTLLPATGITLPVLSYGGSSLFSTMLAFGMAVSASRARTEAQPVGEA